MSSSYSSTSCSSIETVEEENIKCLVDEVASEGVKEGVKEGEGEGLGNSCIYTDYLHIFHNEGFDLCGPEGVLTHRNSQRFNLFTFYCSASCNLIPILYIHVHTYIYSPVYTFHDEDMEMRVLRCVELYLNAIMINIMNFTLHNEIGTTLVLSSNWRYKRKLLVVVPASHKCKPGIWSRSSCLDKGMSYIYKYIRSK
jgi:hypothetical protein